MGKRLTVSDYVFAFMFIFMLVCIVFAFLYGEKIGISKTTTKFNSQLADHQAKKNLTAYDEQTLVSFYHTIFSPYHTFSARWFKDIAAIQSKSSAVDSNALMKELRKLADHQLKEMKSIAIPKVSPLLQQAQADYINSLQEYISEIPHIERQTGTLSAAQLISFLSQDSKLTEAEKDALTAQSNYYTAIVKWNLSFNPLLKNKNAVDTNTLTVEAWSTLNLNLKNEWTASFLLRHGYFEPYYVQDITARIDQMIGSGQAKSMNFSNIDQIAELLIQLSAVRSGDFIQNKNQLYAKEVLPQLPFFFSD